MNEIFRRWIAFLTLTVSLFVADTASAAPIEQSALLKRVDVGDVRLAVRLVPGEGIPILFIHGSWGDHHGWLPVANDLIGKVKNPIILYDRRGHSASTDVPGQGHISGDVEDAARLLKVLGFSSAHVVGHSYGANIAIALADAHPELVSSLFLYEPPAFGLLKGREKYAADLGQTKQAMLNARAALENGEIEQGTILFIENVAFGQGSWRNLFDDRARATMVANADTWLDQSRDEERLRVQVQPLDALGRPITLVYGDRTFPVYRDVAEEIRATVPAIHLQQCHDAGHGGPVSRPEQVARMLIGHLRLVQSGSGEGDR